MREESVARRYAAALFLQAQKENRLDETYREIQVVAETVRQTPSLSRIIHQQLLDETHKKAALKSVFGASVSSATMGFLNLLVDKRRIGLLPEAASEFVGQVRSFRNIEVATATTAIPLTPEQEAELVRTFEARTGKTIEMKTEIDPSVLGGVRVRIGDTVFDGTVHGNLERLREQLLVRR